MLVFPNAKINFGLNVVARRVDGFHNIETLFYPINLHDLLEIKSAATNYEYGYNFINYGLTIDCPAEKNLVIKAVKLIDKIKKLPSLDIVLHKSIPFGGGLGGGSSNGAFTLNLLNQQFSVGLSNLELENIAESLGSDCPFFIRNRPCLAYEKGNLLHDEQEILKGYHILLIIPPISVNTAMAYSQISPALPKVGIKEAIHYDPKDWKKYIFNDFEYPVFKLFPQIAAVKNNLYQSGAFYASMSGSGSSVYGLFDKEPDINEFKDSNNFVWQGKL